MRPNSKAERKLRRGIEAMVDKANMKFYGWDSSEGERQERYLGDIVFSERLAMQVADIIECRKASEKYLQENLRCKRYRVEATIDAESFNYSVLGAD